MIVALPGSTARLKWTFMGYPSAVVYIEWHFTRRGGSITELIARKFPTRAPTIANSSLPRVDIEDTTTLVLKNVDKRYNGKYCLGTFGRGGSAAVELFIAGKF